MSSIRYLRDTTRALTERAWDAALGEDYHGAVDVLTERDRLGIAAVALEAVGHPARSPSPRAEVDQALSPEDPHQPGGNAVSAAPRRAVACGHAWSRALTGSRSAQLRARCRPVAAGGVSESQLVAAS